MDIELPRTIHSLPIPRHPVKPIITSSGIMRVTCACCGERFSKALTPMEKLNVVKMYSNAGHHPDGHVQDIFPTWSVSERELFLMSNLCEKCWETIMGGDEE